MEIECTKCHRRFHSLKEMDAVCPECLRQEFSAAPKMDDEESQELRDSFRLSAKRQHARAEMMNIGYATGATFSVAGKIQFCIAMFIFLGCCMLFYAMGGAATMPLVGKLDEESLRMFSIVLCWTAAALVATSSSRRKRFTIPMAIIMILFGWFLPDMVKQEDVIRPIVMQQVKTGETPSTDNIENGPVLNNDDLQVFIQFRKSAPHRSHYAVYIDKQDSRTRALVREALTRLLRAEYTSAYTRADGALYVVSNVPGKINNISDVLSRFGNITYSNISEGVYEIQYNEEQANIVSKYPPEVLASPLNTSFVTANISELTSLDSMRVRMAARSLKNANVQILRREVHDALLRALSDPWEQDADTYTALIEALVVYAYPKDAKAIPLCFRYFNANRTLHKDVPDIVMEYLVKEIPDQMLGSVLDFWYENPLSWQKYVESLGAEKVQASMLSRLNQTKQIREINNILRYLQKHGTIDAIPFVEKYINNSDSIIRHSAKETLKVLRSRG